MKRASHAFIILAIIAATGVFSCSDSESRIPFGYARAVINLNLPPETTDAQAGLIERMRRFLVPDAVAQSAPAAFSNITVRVTGPDIALIEKSFAPYSTISLSVPAGALRIFEVTAYVAPGDPSAALSFRGTSSANCPAGATVNVPVVMGLNETKIVIPDNGNSRVVVKDSMHSGWHVISTFQQPMDIDFDSRGRIYVVDQFMYYVWRLESITDSTPEQVSDTDWLFCLAVDRYRNRVFYSDETDLWQNILSGGNEQLKNRITAPASIEEIFGMDAAPDGMLYIVGQVNDTGVTNDAVIQYDPDANSGAGAIVRTSFASTEIQAVLNNPVDIQVKWPYLYVTNSSGTAGMVILKILVSGDGFILADSFGTLASTYPDTPAGDFFGPLQFVGLRSNGLVVMDHYSTYDRLVFFGNNLNSGWDTLGGFSGSGVDQFNF
jgi:hypothetical protein